MDGEVLLAWGTVGLLLEVPDDALEPAG